MTAMGSSDYEGIAHAFAVMVAAGLPAGLKGPLERHERPKRSVFFVAIADTATVLVADLAAAARDCSDEIKKSGAQSSCWIPLPVNIVGAVVAVDGIAVRVMRTYEITGAREMIQLEVGYI